MDRVSQQHIRFCRAHIEHDWQSIIWRPWLAEFGRHFTLLRYDQRGCGLSDRDVRNISFEAWLSDLETVVEAAGLARFTLLGMSQGASIAIAYAVRHPERLSKLVIYGGFARGRRKRGIPDQDEEAEVHGRRLYVTNSAISSIDFSPRYALRLIHVGPDGKLKQDPNFQLDFSKGPDGPARPHDMLLN